MNVADRQALVAIPVIVAIGAAIAWAGSQGSVQAGPLPLFAWCALLAFVINWIVFVPSYLAQSERFFDLTGSLSYVSVVALAAAFAGGGPRAGLVAGLVTVWAVRLGSFLFSRIRREGGDGRFDELKPSLPRFAMTWTLQGLWVLLTLSCGLAAMTSSQPVPLDAFALVGAGVWAAGFAIEVAADRQKSRFRADPANRDRFIESGLWAWSRHPNYFGEILLWVGIALIALPVLSGWQYATLISPVFVYVLLTRISGIPMLESRAKKRWGDDPAYCAYKSRTPALLPRPPRPA
jgi:steroid 5-alpha reductase family enzyme